MSEYFRAHFIQVHKRKDVNHRPLYLVRVFVQGLTSYSFCDNIAFYVHACAPIFQLFLAGDTHRVLVQDIKATQNIIVNGTNKCGLCYLLFAYFSNRIFHPP